MGKKKGKLKKGEYEWSGDVRRIIPLKNNYCYIQDEKGKLHHLTRDSEEFYTLVRHLNDVMNDKITKELTDLGWDAQLSKLDSESVS